MLTKELLYLPFIPVCGQNIINCLQPQYVRVNDDGEISTILTCINNEIRLESRFK